MSKELLRQIVINLRHQLEILENSNEDAIQKLEDCFQESYEALKELKELFSETPSRTMEDEIYFFKRTKPYVLSKVITYSELYRLEVKKPINSNKVVLKYYKTYIDKLQGYIDSKIEFYNYYRMDSKFLDEQYFTRRETDLRLYPDAAYFCTDTEFTTSHDTVLATLMAYESIIVYVKQEMSSLNRDQYTTAENSMSTLNWTANKSDLVELIYAIQGTNAINNGNATLKEIASFFNLSFNVKIADYSRVYFDLQARSQKTKFIDMLKETLENKIEKSLNTRK
ncbi:RteC domain-containing protein [Aestuariibaculum marinum]|uniref:RteC domain-containing protein n=1 Tax=Aestuariibaculum marinum TaxID=2683592 RepID=A0A8J6PYJ6_9FLAO|nr:RteC domain-containing protein [Aestuariibaculum marinum]MBD0824416.1 RteC domain-containing protein [Aestuariibaculum marinum]